MYVNIAIQFLVLVINERRIQYELTGKKIAKYDPRLLLTQISAIGDHII